MLQFCLSCCFFIYLSGIFIFLILSIFAFTGNPALLMENYLTESNKVEDGDEKEVKRRTQYQYLFASLSSLVFTIIFYYFAFIFLKNDKETNDNDNYNNINIVGNNSFLDYKEYDDGIINTSKKPVELSAPSPYSINNAGMSEKDSSED